MEKEKIEEGVENNVLDVENSYLFDVDWNSPITEDEMQRAMDFLMSTRGRYIISQALTQSVLRMEEVPESYREHSNIEDMKYLIKTLFNMYYMIKKAEMTPKMVKTLGLPMVCLNPTCTRPLWRAKNKEGKLPTVCPICKSKNIRVV